MTDVAAGIGVTAHHATRSSAQRSTSASKSTTPWLTVLIGLLLTGGLFALKVTALGLEEGWGFVADLREWSRNWSWSEVRWHVPEWTNVGIYLLEAAIAGAAGSIVFNYAVNNVSQTISNIWQQIDLTESTDPTIMRVEPDTRAWLSGLSRDAADRAAQAMRDQDLRIQQLLAEITRLEAQNAGLDSDLEARNARLSDAFATIIEQIRLLREDLGRRRPND